MDEQSTPKSIDHISQKIPTRPYNEVIRQVNVGGFDAVDVHLKKRSNLHDPFVNMEVIINNPVGRLWEAIKRIWKSQKTIISFKFSIPLLVLPILLFVGLKLWQGRGVSIPMAKVGVIHALTLDGQPSQTLILPTSDVFLLHYPSSMKILPSLEKPVVVFGMYNHLNNTLTVEKVSFYNPEDERPSSYAPTGVSSVTGTNLLQQIASGIWTPIANFFELFR